MRSTTGLFAGAPLGASFGSAGLGQAQSTSAPGAGQTQARQGVPHNMPMQGGTMRGQGDTAQSGCPPRDDAASAALEERLRRLEERLGVPTPPPARPGAPG